MMYRLTAVTLLVISTAALYATGRMLGIEPLAMAAGLGFGVLAGVAPTLVVLAIARRSVPATDPYEAPGVRDWRPAERRRADERAELEAEYNHTGQWTTINGRTCYVVPQVDPFSGDGEEVGFGDNGHWQYWLGDYRSDRQFTVAGVITDGGGIARHSSAIARAEAKRAEEHEQWLMQ